MTDNQRDQRPHFILSGYAKTEKFRSVSSGGGRPSLPPLNRAIHGAALLRQIARLKPIAETAKQAQEDIGLDNGLGIQVHFASQPGIELAFESLARERSGIELLNVKHEDGITSATVFVPDGKLDVFEKLMKEYLQENTEPSKKYPNGRPKHQDLIETIREIRAAELLALWTDSPESFPVTDDEAIWWEMWLPVRGNREKEVARFRFVAEKIGFQVAGTELEFPERTVLLAHGTKGQMKRSVMLLNHVAELRRAKETAEFFDSLLPIEQQEWIEKLLSRSDFPSENVLVPYICILDTGINRGHPLLVSVLASGDLHTVDPNWGVDDQEGHGTEMAGLALYGDLTDVMGSTDSVQLNHRLESVKLLQKNGDNQGEHFGALTVEAVSRPEVTAPRRSRVFSMAVTAQDNRDRGRPSAWSGAIDGLAADWSGDGGAPRLIVVAAGNINDPGSWPDYPNSNSTDGIHDPGQAWNALTVGAYTEKSLITEKDAQAFVPIAPVGGLSPFSTTSATWGKHTPLKPDVLFEGGNAAKDAISACWMHSLSLLTTHYAPQERLLTTTNATSAATALCARMAAQLMVAYPTLWPETIRALIVHSARWSDAMMRMFKADNRRDSGIRNLVRHCGFGIPDLDRAMWSASNSLTLIVQESLQPFEKERDGIKTRDMSLHELPWPLPELQALGETMVEMRVTLSYFVEPNPAERGIKGRYRYESHGLRFDVKRPAESLEDFRKRVNRLARDEEEGTRTTSTDSGWMLGSQLRHRGSIHCDVWRGTAADLAERGILVIYPALGWWKTRAALRRYDKTCRYALVVSILAPEMEVDLYNAVLNQITVPASILV